MAKKKATSIEKGVMAHMLGCCSDLNKLKLDAAPARLGGLDSLMNRLFQSVSFQGRGVPRRRKGEVEVEAKKCQTSVASFGRGND